MKYICQASINILCNILYTQQIKIGDIIDVLYVF